MADPAKAFKTNPYSKAALEIDYVATSPGWGGELREKVEDQWISPKPSGNPEAQFANGHLEQLGHATGKLLLTTGGKEREFKIDLLRLGDHYWGPRYCHA